MKPITSMADLRGYGQLLSGMMETTPGRTYEFNAEWIRKAGWKVVPVEDTCHFAPVEIERIVSALKRAGYEQCFAIASESVDPDPSCYRLAVSEEDFRQFNKECGPFRFVLVDGNRSWAISCNEWYNLFAAKPDLLESLLGQSIEQARREFVDFASLLAKGNTEEPLLQVAAHYASL